MGDNRQMLEVFANSGFPTAIPTNREVHVRWTWNLAGHLSKA